MKNKRQFAAEYSILLSFVRAQRVIDLVQYKCYRQPDYRKTILYPISFIEGSYTISWGKKEASERGYYEYNN